MKRACNTAEWIDTRREEGESALEIREGTRSHETASACTGGVQVARVGG